MENGNNNGNPSTIDVIRENYTTRYAGIKTCPRCGTQMPSSVILCPNCSAYTSGTTVPESKRRVAASGKQTDMEQFKKTVSGCLIQFLIIAGLAVPFVAAALLPEHLRDYGIAAALAVVSGFIYILAYWLIVKLYMKQIPQTDRLDNADLFSSNFRITGSQD